SLLRKCDQIRDPSPIEKSKNKSRKTPVKPTSPPSAAQISPPARSTAPVLRRDKHAPWRHKDTEKSSRESRASTSLFGSVSSVSSGSAPAIFAKRTHRKHARRVLAVHLPLATQNAQNEAMCQS